METKSARTGVENNISVRASLSKAALQRRTPQRGRDSALAAASARRLTQSSKRDAGD
jgi:hypothetical protein